LIINPQRLFDDLPLAFSRHVFITSDNLQSILELKAAAEHRQWTVGFSHVFRMHNGFDFYSSNGNRSTTIELLMQLMMSLECEAWVGTRGSNWNRLMDELRCVWVDKCMQPFVEVGNIAQGSYEWR
jgi:hypothetical protein